MTSPTCGCCCASACATTTSPWSARPPTAIEVLDACDRSSPVDAIVLDLLMPRMNGFEVIPELQRDHPQIGIVAYTAVAGDFVRREMSRLEHPAPAQERRRGTAGRSTPRRAATPASRVQSAHAELAERRRSEELQLLAVAAGGRQLDLDALGDASERFCGLAVGSVSTIG